MAHKQIIEYIKEQREKGFSDEKLREVLQKAGWPEEKISMAFSEVDKETDVDEGNSAESSNSHDAQNQVTEESKEEQSASFEGDDTTENESDESSINDLSTEEGNETTDSYQEEPDREITVLPGHPSSEDSASSTEGTKLENSFNVEHSDAYSSLPELGENNEEESLSAEDVSSDKERRSKGVVLAVLAIFLLGGVLLSGYFVWQIVVEEIGGYEQVSKDKIEYWVLG